MAEATPSLEQFLGAARDANPGVSDDDLTGYWQQNYAPKAAVSSMPSRERFLSEARKLNEGVSDDQLLSYWGETYGAKGAPEKEPGDISRGFKVAFEQLPQLGYGLAAITASAIESAAGDGGLATSAKNWAVKGYQDWGQKIQSEAKDTDEFDVAFDRAKEGDFASLVDWLQYGVGYSVAQGLQILGTAGAGALVGKAALKPAVEKLAAGLVAKETAKLVAAGVAKEAATRQAVATIAAQAGALAATGAQAFGMEGGEIGGGLAERSVKEGRVLSGTELARAAGATGLAGLYEFAGDALGLGALLGKVPVGKAIGGMTGLGGRAARGVVAGLAVAPAEGLTEYLQTGVEEFGKGTEENLLPGNQSPENQRQALNAAALGAIGGAVMGAGGGAMTGPSVADQKTAKAIGDISTAPDVDTAIAVASAAAAEPVGPAAPIADLAEAGGVWPLKLEPRGLIESAQGESAIFESVKEGERMAAVDDPQRRADVLKAVQETVARQQNAFVVPDRRKEAELDALQQLHREDGYVPAADDLDPVETQPTPKVAEGQLAPTIRALESARRVGESQNDYRERIKAMLRQRMEARADAPGSQSANSEPLAPKTVAGEPVAARTDAELQALAADPQTPATTGIKDAAPQEAVKTVAEPIQPGPTVPTATKEPWRMSSDEFATAVQRGKLHKATGRAVAGEKEAKTPLRLGELNGYSYDDIALFYASRRGYPGSATAAYDPIEAGREELLRDARVEGKIDVEKPAVKVFGKTMDKLTPKELSVAAKKGRPEVRAAAPAEIERRVKPAAKVDLLAQSRALGLKDRAQKIRDAVERGILKDAEPLVLAEADRLEREAAQLTDAEQAIVEDVVADAETQIDAEAFSSKSEAEQEAELDQVLGEQSRETQTENESVAVPTDAIASEAGPTGSETPVTGELEAAPVTEGAGEPAAVDEAARIEIDSYKPFDRTAATLPPMRTMGFTKAGARKGTAGGWGIAKLGDKDVYSNGHILDTSEPPYKTWRNYIGEKKFTGKDVSKVVTRDAKTKIEPVATGTQSLGGRDVEVTLFRLPSGEFTALDHNYVSYFIAKYPKAGFFSTGDVNASVAVMDGRKLAGIIMPMRWQFVNDGVEEALQEKFGGKKTAEPQATVAEQPAAPETPADHIAKFAAAQLKAAQELNDAVAKPAATAKYDAMFPRIERNHSDGRYVRDRIPNTTSIVSSFSKYEMLPGIRDVPMSAMDQEYISGVANRSLDERAAKLQSDIAESGEINPLIVAVDDTGPFRKHSMAHGGAPAGPPRRWRRRRLLHPAAPLAGHRRRSARPAGASHRRPGARRPRPPTDRTAPAGAARRPTPTGLLPAGHWPAW